MKRLLKVASIPLTCLALTAAPAMAQEFPDAASLLRQELAAFAAPFVAEEGPNLTMPELAATIVCIVDALEPLPEDIKRQMLDQDDFEDALDLAVIYGEDAKLPMEHRSRGLLLRRRPSRKRLVQIRVVKTLLTISVGSQKAE